MGHDLPFDPDFGFDPRSSILRDELTPGEAIVWEGRPDAGTMASRSLFTTFFGVFFFSFAVFWTYSVTHAPFGGWRALFGVPFLAVGAGLVLAPLWAAIDAGRTRYAVTDRRVILCEPSGLGIRVQSYAPAALGSMARTQRPDGSGDLIFEEIRTRDRDGDRRITRRGFQAIRDVRRVEGIIRSTLLGERP